MIILSAISFIASIIYICLGIYVVKADRASRINRLFFLLCSFFAIWSFCYTFVYISDNPFEKNIWIKISAIGWCLSPALMLHITFIITNIEQRIMSSGFLELLYFPGFILLGAHVLLYNNGIWLINNIGPIFYFAENLHYMVYSILCLYLIYNWGRLSQLKREKMQSRIIVKSGIVSLVTGNFVQIILPALNILILPQMSQIVILILALGLWHSIINYKFLGVSALITTNDIIEKVTEIIILLDSNLNITSINNVAENLLGYAPHELINNPIDVLIASRSRDELKKIKQMEHNNISAEIYFLSRERNKIPFSTNISKIYDKSGDFIGTVLVGQDISLLYELQKEINDRKQKEQQLRYLSLHDSLTSLYNRTFFEQEMARLENERISPVGIIIFDLDGLKLINDTLGHGYGDILLRACAKVIKDNCPEGSISARIGGDEFAIISPYANEEAVKHLVCNIRSSIALYNDSNPELHLSISMGSANSGTVYSNIYELYKSADNIMYREKLNRSKSVRSSMVHALLAALEARDFITEGHAVRIQDLALLLAEDIGLSENEINDLQLLAQFHDIGKIGIPDRILFKPGSLTPEEREEMKKHCEIGYRIAQSLPDLIHISDLILKHHEKWDGSGYPLGISKESIPLQCRILAIVDAYDAMVNDRPYRKAMSMDSAIKEIQNNSGTQFDPQIVARFINLLQRDIAV